jgi:DNA polymerase III epsilon subunit-like protein
MKYLVIDTETTGLHDFSLPADAPGQPRLAHLSMIWADEDLKEVDRQDVYVRPDGWSMPQGPNSAGAVNGLTDDFLRANGADISVALDAYVDEIERGLIVVAFNAQYDCKIMRGELRRAGRDDLFDRTKNICVMRPLTGICRIPRPNGKGLKFPNLTEALDYFKVKPAQFKAHGAVDDAHGALLIMRELHRIGMLPEAAVHYAKEKPEGKPAKKRLEPAPAGAWPESF